MRLEQESCDGMRQQYRLVCLCDREWGTIERELGRGGWVAAQVITCQDLGFAIRA